MPHEACFDSFEAEMLEPCGLSAIWVLSTFSNKQKGARQLHRDPFKLLQCVTCDRHRWFWQLWLRQ
jgi:hypothetical protein